MTSAIESPRRCLAELSPNTQRTASIILDFPQPLGPMTAVNGLRNGIWETYENGKIVSTEDASKPNSKSFKYIKNEKGELVPSELKVKK